VKPLSPRDRKALFLVAGLAVLTAGVLLWPEKSAEESVAASDTVPHAERRLTSLLRKAGGLPAREELNKRFSDELGVREKGLIVADTPAQAQAQLLEVVRRVAQSQTPPLDLRGADFAPIKAFEDGYGELTVTISADCGIEQLVNFMADLTNQPELLATSDMSLGLANPKKKTIPVRMTISALTPKSLAPEKKREMTF
jgi:hypothetical protein